MRSSRAALMVEAVLLALLSLRVFAQQPAINFVPAHEVATPKLNKPRARAVATDKNKAQLQAQGCIELGHLTLTVEDERDVTATLLEEATRRRGDVVLFVTVNDTRRETRYDRKCLREHRYLRTETVCDYSRPGNPCRQVSMPGEITCDEWKEENPHTVVTTSSSAHVFRCEYDRKNKTPGRRAPDALRAPAATPARPPAIATSRHGALDDTIRRYTEVIRREPNSAEAFFNRGNAYSEQAMLQEQQEFMSLDAMVLANLAIQDYSEATRLKPDYADAYYGRGLAYHRKGDHKAAIRDYDAAIRLNPAHLAAHAARKDALAGKRPGADSWRRRWGTPDRKD